MHIIRSQGKQRIIPKGVHSERRHRRHRIALRQADPGKRKHSCAAAIGPGSPSMKRHRRYGRVTGVWQAELPKPGNPASARRQSDRHRSHMHDDLVRSQGLRSAPRFATPSPRRETPRWRSRPQRLLKSCWIPLARCRVRRRYRRRIDRDRRAEARDKTAAIDGLHGASRKDRSDGHTGCRGVLCATDS